MKLTVMGRSAACPNPGEACSGYLVERDDARLVLDCGTGIVSRLRLLVDYRTVSAIVISHMHFDHFADLIPYAYGLRLGKPLETGYRPQLYLPPGGLDVMNQVVAQWRDLAGFVHEVFEAHEFDPGKEYVFGPLTVGFVEVRHYVPCWGISVTGGGRRLAYSADSGPSGGLINLAANADLFLSEAALVTRVGAEKQYGHLSAWEAGGVARAASAKRLLLSHIWQEADPDRILEEARRAFSGPVEIAEESKGYQI